jgi:hypothetical protein
VNEAVAPIVVHPTHQPRALLAVLTLIAVLIVLVFAVLSYPAIVDSRNASQAVEDQAALTACRGKYRADIDDAGLAVSAANSQLDLVTNEALEAILTNHSADLQALSDQVHMARDTLETSLTVLAARNHAYRDAVDQSQDDPQALLATCN